MPPQGAAEIAESAEDAEFRAETPRSGDAGVLGDRLSFDLDLSAASAHVRNASVRTSIACQRRRMRYSTASLRQDFARCIKPDTGERQAKSPGDRGLIRGQG